MLATGVVTAIGTLLAIQHVVTLLSMLLAMLRRREEYTHGNHSHTPPTSASAA